MGDKQTYREERLKPPVWDPEKQNYNEWKFLVELWDTACIRAKLSKADRSYNLFAKLKDVEKKGIGNMLVSAARVGTLNVFGDDGVKQITDILDERFLLDDLSVKKKAWQAFISIKRSGLDDIDTFIEKFDRACAELKIAGRDLDNEIYALQLLQSANLTEECSRLVITGINEKEEDIFEQTKKALRKYLGSEKSGVSAMIKGNDEIFAAEEEAYSTNRMNHWGAHGSGSFRGRGRGRTRNNYNRGRNRPPSRNQDNRRSHSQEENEEKVGDQEGPKLNPLDQEGNRITCWVCGCIYHLAGKNGINCPNSFQNQKTKKVNLAEGEEEAEEAHKCDIQLDAIEVYYIKEGEEGLLDSCCTSNVMGKKWMENFVSNMSDSDIKEVKTSTSKSAFKFGDEPSVRSTEKVTFPCYVLGERTTLCADVVDRNIPLLISKEEMKKRKFILNFDQDTLEVDGKKHNLSTTSKGHFKLPLWSEEECNISFNEMSEKEKKSAITKLHRQFRHQPAGITEDLLKRADCLTPELRKMNEDIAEACETCLKFKKNKPRPVVAPPLANTFNDVVAMDLKVLTQFHSYIIYFIDLYTRFMRGCVLKRKIPDVVVESFITTWIAAGFGAPRKVLVDNGGEFDNPLYLEAMEQYNIEVCATGARSPWSNGICERNHCVVDVMIEKMTDEDKTMKLEVALANAISAKNSLYNYNGFAPIQLVTGSLPNLPNVLNKALPALEEPSSTIISNSLNAMNLARKAFVQAEASEKISRALKHPVRATEENFENGEKVYYKVNSEPKWRGPGKVIGQLGTRVLVLHGSRLHRCHANAVIKVGSNEEVKMNKNDKREERFPMQTHAEKETMNENSINKDSHENIEDREREVEHPEVERRSKREVAPRKVYDADEGKWKEVRNDEDHEAHVVMIPVSRHNDQDVMVAKSAELQNWKDMQVVDIVEDRGQKRISTRWVVSEKGVPDGSKLTKARLVVRGFEEEEQLQKDAPTASKTSLRITFGFAMDNNWEIETIDIRAAFLQSQQIEREVYVIPPKEAGIDGKLWRLRKPVYGLVDAARCWFLSLQNELPNCGCKQSQLDKAVFRWMKNSLLEGIFVLHVDDFFITGSKNFFDTVGGHILAKYIVGKRANRHFEYVGLNIQRNTQNMIVDQNSYAEEIDKTGFEIKGRKNEEKVNLSELRNLRSIIGQIHWLSSQTRPDLSFDALELSIERNNASVATLKRANKVIKKVKEGESRMSIQAIGQILSLDVYADASFCNLPDGKSSTSGSVILLRGSKGSRVIDWNSTKIKRKVSSTLEAESLSLKEALNNAIYLGSFISELLFDDFRLNKIPIEGFTDNQPTEQSIRSTKQVSEKRLRIDIGEIQRLLEDKEIQDVKWISKEKQLADGLTKRDVNMDDLLYLFNKTER